MKKSNLSPFFLFVILASVSAGLRPRKPRKESIPSIDDVVLIPRQQFDFRGTGYSYPSDITVLNGLLYVAFKRSSSVAVYEVSTTTRVGDYEVDLDLDSDWSRIGIHSCSKLNAVFIVDTSVTRGIRITQLDLGEGATSVWMEESLESVHYFTVSLTLGCHLVIGRVHLSQSPSPNTLTVYDAKTGAALRVVTLASSLPRPNDLIELKGGKFLMTSQTPLSKNDSVVVEFDQDGKVTGELKGNDKVANSAGIHLPFSPRTDLYENIFVVDLWDHSMSLMARDLSSSRRMLDTVDRRGNIFYDHTTSRLLALTPQSNPQLQVYDVVYS